MATARELLALAERSEREAAELEEWLKAAPSVAAALLEQAREMVRVHREQAGTLRELAAIPILTTPHIPNTIDPVEQDFSSNALRSRKQFSSETQKTKFAQVLAKKGVTFADVSEALTERLKRKVPRSTVQSWAKPKTDGSYRAIPQDAAEALRALYGVPLTAWPRIIPAP